MSLMGQKAASANDPTSLLYLQERTSAKRCQERTVSRRAMIAAFVSSIRVGPEAGLKTRNDVERPLPPRPQLQAFQSGGDAEADLALQAERLQRDRIVGAADQHIAAGADPDRRTALSAGISAGEIAGPEPRHRREHTPGQRRFLGDAEIEAHFPDGRDIAVLESLGAQHANEVGHRADDEADAGAAAAFEDADLDPLHRLLCVRGEGCKERGHDGPKED
jgi:hypothetical protein